MSLTCLLIHARAGSQMLHNIPKQIQLSAAVFSSRSSISTTIPLAQSTNAFANTMNFATAARQKYSTPTTQWMTIYRLPMIRLVAGFQRLKIYQAAITTIALPITLALSQFGQLSEEAVAVVAAIGVSGMGTLLLCSLVVRNVIGFVYVSEEGDKLKLAYVDYWGKRQELIVEMNDLDVEWGRANPVVANFYRNLRLYSDKKKKFKLLINYGIIVEPETFSGIFGD